MSRTISGVSMVLAAALTFLASGCASKSEVANVQGDVSALQSEWEMFEKGYDPALRAELESNIRTYEKLNEEMGALVNETRHKANRVSELLAQIDNNAVDRAVRACEETRVEAERTCEAMRSEAAHNAQMAQEYAEEVKVVSNALLERHEVNSNTFIHEIKTMKVQMGRLDKALQAVKKENQNRRLAREVETLRKQIKRLEKELGALQEK